MRRLFALVFAACFTFGPATMSLAGVDASVQFRFASSGERPNDFTPRPGSTLTDSWRIVVDASASSSLSYFRVAIEAQEPIPESLPSSSALYRSYAPGASNSDRFTLDWNTRTITKYNGVYRIVAKAESHGGNSETGIVGDLKVENPPVVPTDVSVRLENDAPVVTWRANPEPDIKLYRIYRSDNGGVLSLVGSTTERRFIDSKAPTSTSLRYQVVAVRHSPSSAAGISSPPSKPSGSIMIIPPEASGQSNHVIDISNPAPVTRVKPKTVVAKQGNLGFAPLLPYDSVDLPVAVEEPEPEIPVEQAPVAQSLPQIVRSTVYKPPFIAAALLLLVTAMHVLRIAGRLFSAQSSASSNTARILGSST